nr:hypothetical protein [uncultured Desulfobacter sp.]
MKRDGASPEESRETLGTRIVQMGLDLIWKPTADLIRFVLAITNRGPIILMCSDLEQDPVTALELYCARVRIETMFDMLKNVMGVFRYRFWTKGLHKSLNELPKINQTSEIKTWMRGVPSMMASQSYDSRGSHQKGQNLRVRFHRT